MSQERNADSVLFKVDALKEMAKAQAAEGGAKRQLARLAASTPQSETGSGLIDIQSLASGTPPAEHTPGATSATAATTGLGQAASSATMSQSNLLSGSSPSLLDATAPATAAPQPAAPSRTPLVILSVLAIAALCAVVAALVLRG